MVVHVATRLNVGGISRHLAVITTQLGEWNGVLLVGEPDAREGSLAGEIAAAGARVVTVPGLKRTLNPLADLRATWWLYRYFRRERPRLVMTHMAKAGALGRIAGALAGVPILVHTFHGHVLQGYFGPLRNTAFRLAEQALGRLTSRFIAVSEEIALDLQAMGIGRGKFTVIPYGFELDHLDRGRKGVLRRALKVGPEARLVGIVGRLVPIKAHDLFLEAARRVRAAHPEARFVIVGDGELWDALHRQARELGLEEAVHFTGWRQDLPDVYADLDVAVCCSHNEGTPVAVIEASAARRPVVGTRVGGMGDIIQDGVTGLLVPPADAGELARAISRILEDPALAARMGDEGRRRVLVRCGSGRLVEDMRKFYGTLLEESRVRGIA